VHKPFEQRGRLYRKLAPGCRVSQCGEREQAQAVQGSGELAVILRRITFAVDNHPYPLGRGPRGQSKPAQAAQQVVELVGGSSTEGKIFAPRADLADRKECSAGHVRDPLL